MQIDNLPDCPCCGGESEYIETMYGAGMILSASIRCRDCGLKIEHRGAAGKIADTRAKVIAAWSCRVPKNKLCLIVSQYYYSRYCFWRFTIRTHSARKRWPALPLWRIISGRRVIPGQLITETSVMSGTVKAQGDTTSTTPETSILSWEIA